LALAALLYAPLYLAVWCALPGGPRLLRAQAGLVRHLRARGPSLIAELDADDG
jgi:hypothetical protein